MRPIVCIVLFLILKFSYSQKILELNYHSVFGKEKSYQFFNNSKIDYKLKGDLFYRTHRLVNLNDSVLVFDNDSVIKISQVKVIKIRGMNISPYFFGSSLLLFLLDTGNNIAKGHSTIVNEQTAIVCSSLILAGIIVRRIQDKHVYIRKHVTIRVLDTDYQNLTKTN